MEVTKSTRRDAIETRRFPGAGTCGYKFRVNERVTVFSPHLSIHNRTCRYRGTAGYPYKSATSDSLVSLQAYSKI